MNEGSWSQTARVFRSDKILHPEEAQLSLITVVSHIKQSCQFGKENNCETEASQRREKTGLVLGVGGVPWPTRPFGQHAPSSIRAPGSLPVATKTTIQAGLAELVPRRASSLGMAHGPQQTGKQSHPVLSPLGCHPLLR